MMLRPAVSQILKNNESYYSLVIAVAKRAREITSDAFDNKLVLDEKPVKTAVDELYNGEYKNRGSKPQKIIEAFYGEVYGCAWSFYRGKGCNKPCIIQL